MKSRILPQKTKPAVVYVVLESEAKPDWSNVPVCVLMYSIGLVQLDARSVLLGVEIRVFAVSSTWTACYVSTEAN